MRIMRSRGKLKPWWTMLVLRADSVQVTQWMWYAYTWSFYTSTALLRLTDSKQEILGFVSPVTSDFASQTCKQSCYRANGNDAGKFFFQFRHEDYVGFTTHVPWLVPLSIVKYLIIYIDAAGSRHNCHNWNLDIRKERKKTWIQLHE